MMITVKNWHGKYSNLRVQDVFTSTRGERVGVVSPRALRDAGCTSRECLCGGAMDFEAGHDYETVATIMGRDQVSK